MFDRPDSGERAVLVHLTFHTGQEDLAELKELAKSAGTDPVYVVTGSRKRPDAKYFMGTGKLDELKLAVQDYAADVVLVNHPLSPSQERNLEGYLGVRVVDRNGLILDIFAQRAQSFEGKLQVELAQLKHLSTRLVRGWTHLERQKGGIGLRGPGETQLETDRRLLAGRIKQIQQRLDKVDKQRHQGRSQRKKAEIPTVSLVGYTNAGKSTLFNQLTGAGIYAADQLFATLDPTLRSVQLANNSEIVLADTVGFIRHLPHELVAAFKSTLQEASEAELLLHVIDAHSDDRDTIIAQVNLVLTEIQADTVKQIEVFNKIDLLDGILPHIDRDDAGNPVRVWLSAETGAGMELLVQVLVELFASTKVTRRCFLTPQQGGIRAKLFTCAKIIAEDIDELGASELVVQIDVKHLGLLKEVKTEELP
ncbi:ribosome rescue GTPase HflX [Methylovulum psychrotolerans]|uniref:GTPase HflX n=1 Tax=Methylovulum psychrotolerans TaxID=1704499 RepID=A0A1Z4C0X8_9GAMM|nr:ribosome rescue GTPase HflX [Methylovulum psychrotolerans]ASF47173.1 GTPase HflX [Methylovulum psychrotolerans]MBT9097189.1 GTPase HflX [Methylovulum psychrotolerans]POZ51656.1 GTPase HflX [Methylovulum psychrotolerans]